MKRQEEEWASSLVADFIDQWNASSMEEEEGTSEIIIRFYHNINMNNIFFRFNQQISCAIFIYLFFFFFHVSDRPVELQEVMGEKHVFAALLL